MDQFTWAGLENEDTPNERQLLLGVKAVHKTQYLDIENKYGREWYPVGEHEFATALDDGGMRALKTAQVYFDPNHVADAAYRDEFIQRICRRGKNWLNALQFDMLPWHKDDAMLRFIEELKERTGHTIILQAHGESMQQLGAQKVAKKLGQYAHALDYVLFDASHGEGVRMNPAALLPFLDECYESEQLNTVGFGVAGGLCSEVVRHELPLLVEAYTDLSWDAEGKLHNENFNFDASAAKSYLQASGNLLRSLPGRPV